MLPYLLTAAALAGQPGLPPIYHGRSNQLAVDAPRLEADVHVDGFLDEDVWASAAILTGFSQYQPVDGLPAADSTEVLVWYGQHEMYFGIRAYEPHGVVSATLADRDKLGKDDVIQILLDTFNDRRRALVFGVNPLGVQMDGTWTEGAGHPLDTNPDFIYDSKGRVTEWGYEVEIRVPFKSLRYQPGTVQTWGINVIRQVRHSGYQQTWTPVRQGQASFLAQSGTLEDLTDLRRGLVLDLNPVVTSKAQGAQDAAGDWSYDADRPEFGANVRWGVTENLTLNGTINPDFSQVESDAGQLVFDPRQAVFFAEKRPFFLDGSENFATPNQLIYTRRIADPVAAAKFTGKLSGTDIAVLSAVDAEGLSATGTNNPVFNILRLRRDIGGNSTAGIAYTDRIDGDFYNRVAAADARFVSGLWSVLLQGGASFTRNAIGENAWRPIFEIGASRRSRNFQVSGTFEGTHPQFRALAGFTGRTGIAHLNIKPQYTLFGEPGARIESWTGSVTLDGTWLYDRFTAGRTPDDQKLHLGSDFKFRGGWSFGSKVLLETFRYDPSLYAGYAIDTGTDTVPFVGRRRLPNYDFQITAFTPQWQKFNGGGFFIVGRDENFDEWAAAFVVLADVSGTWRPTDKVRVSPRYVLQRYMRWEDRSLVSERQVPRLKLEYQLSRPIFVRLVGEYDAQRRDDLRDDNTTDLPILIRQSDGSYARATGFERGRFRGDFLFSFQPSPGTVFFAGYGSTLAAEGRAGLNDLRRTNDGFFLKFSYLFRM